jgi:hypothetical protein
VAYRHLIGYFAAGVLIRSRMARVFFPWLYNYIKSCDVQLYWRDLRVASGILIRFGAILRVEPLFSGPWLQQYRAT